MQPPPPRRKSAFNEEFDVLRNIQEDRMAYDASLTCHERCVKDYCLNNFYLGGKSCMQNCLEKISQVTVIANLNFGKFEEHNAQRK